VEARTVVVDAYFMIGAQVRGLIIVDFMQSYCFLLYLSCFFVALVYCRQWFSGSSAMRFSEKGWISSDRRGN
jgi:hypothetical protein